MLSMSWAGISYAAGGGQAQNRMQQIAASVLGSIETTSWVSEGKGPHVVYVFFDPNCPYCHRLYVETRSYVKKGVLTIRWIPVGILMTTSHGKAAAILSAKNPLQAFYQNEDNYTMGNGGIEEDLVEPAVEKKLKRNEALLARTRLGAVPLMLFYNKQGTPRLVQGAPPKKRLAAILADVK